MAKIFGIDTANLFKKKGDAPAPGEEGKGAIGKSLFNDSKLVRRVGITGGLIIFVFGGSFIFINHSLNKPETKILALANWPDQILRYQIEIAALKQAVAELTNPNNSNSDLVVPHCEFEASYV